MWKCAYGKYKYHIDYSIYGKKEEIELMLKDNSLNNNITIKLERMLRELFD